MGGNGMHLCKISVATSNIHRLIAALLGLFFIPCSMGADCQHDVKYHKSYQNKRFLVDVSLKLSPSFQAPGTLEISGFKCMSSIENNENLTMSMSKSASLPQYDIFYTAADGVRFSNILQASVFPWDESLTINMDSTVLSDLLKNIPNFRHFHTKDKQTLITLSRASKYLKEWSKLRSERVAKNPLIYAYPLPKKESDLLLLAINEFNENHLNLHREQVNNITQQPGEVISSMFSKLISGDNNLDNLSKFLENQRTRNDMYFERLISLDIENLNKVEIVEHEPIKGRAFVRANFSVKGTQNLHMQKFLMKRVQSKWLLVSAYQIKKR